MNERLECPDCGAFNTERVHTEWGTDEVRETRICNECPAQFTNKYRMYVKETNDMPT